MCSTLSVFKTEHFHILKCSKLNTFKIWVCSDWRQETKQFCCTKHKSDTQHNMYIRVMFVLNDIYLENNWLFFIQFWVCSDLVQNWTLTYLRVFKSKHIQDQSVFKWQHETKQFCRTKHKWDTQHNMYVRVMFVLNDIYLENNRLFFTQFECVQI